MAGNDDLYSDSIISTRRKMEMISEIVPGELYLSSLLGAVQPVSNLLSKKITHIVSIIKETFPQHRNIKYMLVDVDDIPEADLLEHFHNVNSFIDGAKASGSAVLIHCQAGVSRSATTTIAYLMYSRGISAEEAYTFVKQKRNCIMPNLGFVRQLQEYEEMLRSQGKIGLAGLPPSSSSTNTENESKNDTSSDSTSSAQSDTSNLLEVQNTKNTKFLVHYLRTSMPHYTKEMTDDQIEILHTYSSFIFITFGYPYMLSVFKTKVNNLSYCYSSNKLLQTFHFSCTNI